MQIKLFSDMENKNTYALIGYEDGSVALWDVEKQQVLHKLKLFNDPSEFKFYSLRTKAVEKIFFFLRLKQTKNTICGSLGSMI